jgi:uracil-DNA glycosylase
MNKQKVYQELASEILKCQKCKLCETAIQAVVGEGSLDAKIIFIGEAPGKNEDEQGRPFIGRAGKLLTSLIEEMGMKRDDVWIGNIIKHRPPKNRDPKPEEIEACRDYLTKQLEIIQPQVVITLGRFSFNYFVPDGKITSERGKLIDIGNYKVFPVYHPAAALRNKKFLNTLKDDFSKLSEIIKELK